MSREQWCSTNYSNEQPWREEWQYTNLRVKFVSRGDYGNHIIRSEGEFTHTGSHADYTAYNLDWNQVDLEPSHHRREHGWILHCHVHITLASSDSWPTQRLPQICVFLSDHITRNNWKVQRQNSRWEDRINFCRCEDLDDGKVFLWRSLWCATLLFRLSGMRANQITLKLFSPNPHHIISQHKPCWISGYLTHNQLILAPL